MKSALAIVAFALISSSAFARGHTTPSRLCYAHDHQNVKYWAIAPTQYMAVKKVLAKCQDRTRSGGCVVTSCHMRRR